MKLQNFRFLVNKKFPKIPGNTKLFPGIFGNEIFREFPGINPNRGALTDALTTAAPTTTAPTTVAPTTAVPPPLPQPGPSTCVGVVVRHHTLNNQSSYIL